ncbi:MAG: hypothetical protein JWM10_281 [Myxococcaceae bacterium]|nr:hypothetical protein [Myxococcaceae bacterium]
MIAVGGVRGEAGACSRPPCASEYLLPLSPSRAAVTVPANLPAFAWFPAAEEGVGSATGLRLQRVDGAAEDVPFALERGAGVPSAPWLVRPLAPLAAGATYELRAPRTCMYNPDDPSTRVTTAAAAALPASLGRVTVGDLVEAEADRPPNSGNGSCATQVTDAHREVALTWDATTAPWRSVIVVQLYVDGEPRDLRGTERLYFSVEGYRTQPRDQAYTVCRGSTEAVAVGLSPGVHRFEYRGRVPGSDAVLRSDVVEAELRCGAGGVDCTARPGAAKPAALPMAGLALLALVAGRRRRRV